MWLSFKNKGRSLLGIIFVIQSRHVLALCDPWTAACQAPLSSTASWSLLKCLSTELVKLPNHSQVCQWLKNRPAGDSGSHEFNPRVGKIPWRRPWQPTQVFLRIPMDRGSWQATVHGVCRVLHNWTGLTIMQKPKCVLHYLFLRLFDPVPLFFFEMTNHFWLNNWKNDHLLWFFFVSL